MIKLVLLAAIMLPSANPFADEAQRIAAQRGTAPVRAAIPDPDNPRAVRLYRDKAVQRVGEIARPLVEQHDGGAEALNALSPEPGAKFASCYSEGNASPIKGFDALLSAIAQTPGGGNETATWCLDPEHTALLEKPDLLQAYCDSPLTVALGLRSLPALAAEQKAKGRFSLDFWRLSADWPPWAAPVGILLLTILSIMAIRRWKARRRAYPVVLRH